MNKIFKYLLFIFVVIIPVNVKAYTIVCDTGAKDYNTNFKCYVDELIVGQEYDELSGTLTVPNELMCSISEIDAGLKNTGEGLKFNIKGKPIESKGITFTCKNNKKLNENTFVQLIIEDFKTHIKNAEEDAVEETVRSSYISLNKYIETTNVVVTKSRDTTNGNSLLKSASFDKGVKNQEGNKFRLSKYITEYEGLQVTYDIKEVTLTFEKNVETATVKALSDTNEVELTGNSVYTELNIGQNIIDLEVTSEDGTATTVYTFYIDRLEKGQGLYNKNTDCTLSKLELSGYTIDFDKNKYGYEIVVGPDVTTIAVNAVPTIPSAAIEVFGNTGIKNGSQITIKVTAPDGETTQVYTVKIKKKIDLRKTFSYIALAIGAGVIIFFAVKMISSMNKKNKDDPIYKLKEKRKIENKGAKTDVSAIPTVGTTAQTPAQAPQASAPVQQAPAPEAAPQVQPAVTPQVQPTVTPQVQPTVQPVVTPQIVNNSQNNGSNMQ